jgi:hypothetical protein
VSYLGFPRIHFAGTFQADPSTINNDPAHFDDDRFVARFQQPGPGATNGWWNPSGSGAWRIRGCKVTSALSGDGRSTGDAAVGGTLAQATDRVSGKLVDLDPDQQGVSTIFGLRLGLRLADGSEAFAGDFEATPLTDIWGRCTKPGLGGMQSAGAVYQSVIDVDQWGEKSLSQVVDDLRAGSAESKLSIKFMVDGYDPNRTSPTFTWGRIVGTIGPYVEGEPHHFVAARLLGSSSGALGPAAVRIDAGTSTLSLDLGNSLATSEPGGKLVDAGELQLVTQPSTGAPVLLAATTAGQSSYDSLYRNRAGILSVQLSPAQAEAAAASPLALIGPNGAPLLVEDAAGRYLRADQFVYRMSPGDTQTVDFHATAFGEAAAGIEISASLGGGAPASALTFPAATEKTTADGHAQLTLTASDPGNPRGFIDGQVYQVAYGWDGDTSVPQGNQVNALIWNAYEGPAQPTWIADVQPIFQQFANLYPVMRDIVDLADYADVAQRHWRAIDLAMSLPVEDANYMPVTRDLSPAKRKMISGWLHQQPDPPVFRIDSVESLRQILQVALELEHATIPPYLCAMFSLAPGTNQEVSDLIQSVVMQEMLHMALVCNLLNAVGGHPDMSSPAFVPKFPGHLPGGVRPDLTVALRKCSIAQVRDVFMAIEQPSEPLNIPDDVPAFVDMAGIEVDEAGNVTDAARAAEATEELERHILGVEHVPLTIGWFYQQIGKAIIELGDDIFKGADPSLQMTPEIYTGAPGNVYVIAGKQDALLALQEIERQGEGTPGTDPTDGPRHELAHYFRFQEIVEGRRMIETSPGKWEFTGDPIPFDPAAVLPMADNPDTGSLPAGQLRTRSELWNRAYGDLLRALNGTFNGNPTLLGTAVGLMFSLEVQARALMSMPLSPDSPATAGPAFQPS